MKKLLVNKYFGLKWRQAINSTGSEWLIQQQHLAKAYKRLKSLCRLKSLNWHLVIGAKGSGKTTLLQHTGLNFVHTDELAFSTTAGGSIPNVWLTNESSIFLDMPGTLLTASIWQAFAYWLVKQRITLSSIVITFSLDELAGLTGDTFTQQLQSIQECLTAFAQPLKQSISVYMVITKIDLLAGFTEFFSDLGYEERLESLGIRFPGTAIERLPAFFNNQFDALLQRLSSRVIWRLHQERNRQQRMLIQNFPTQLASIKERLNQLVCQLTSLGLEKTVYTYQGIYFCSTLQQGIPVDYLPSYIPSAPNLPMLASPLAANHQPFFVAQFINQLLKLRAPLTPSIILKHEQVILLICITLFGAGWMYWHIHQQRLQSLPKNYSQMMERINRIPADFSQLAAALTALEETLKNLQQSQPPQWLTIGQAHHITWTKNLPALIKSINQLQLLIRAVIAAQDSDLAALQALKEILQRQHDPIANLLQQTKPLPEPLRNKITRLALQSRDLLLQAAQNSLADIWKKQVEATYLQTLDKHYPIFKGSRLDSSLSNFSHFFAPQGSIQSYFDQWLKPFVDTSRPEWHWREYLSKSLSLPPSVLLQFERANIIKKMFFADNNQLNVDFSLTPLALGPGVKRVTLSFNGQSLSANLGDTKTYSLQWPNAVTHGSLTAVFYDTRSQITRLTITSPWALFRLLDKTNLQAINGTTQYQFTLDINGKAIKYKLIAAQPLNPFIPHIVELFRLPTIDSPDKKT